MDITFRIVGASELERALAQLPKAVAKSVLRGVLRKAGAPIVDHAVALCPHRTGELARSIDIRPTLTRRQRNRRMRGGAAEMFIGPSFPMGAHGHLIEFGTVNMAAQPFLRPAWDAGKTRVLESVRKDIWQALVRVARRLAKRAEAGKIGSVQAAEILG